MAKTTNHKPNKILVIAAHPDDEILGAGGTILKHVHDGNEVHVCIVTKSYSPEWSDEYRSTKIEEAKKINKLMRIAKRHYLGLPTQKLNTIASGEFNQKIRQVIETVEPDIVYTHFKHDINKDHTAVFEGVMTATRPIIDHIEVRCFETMSSTEWNYQPCNMFTPNLFVDIGKFIEKKLEAFAVYKSEVKEYPHPRSVEGVRNWAKKRGNEICKEYAEAFMIMRRFE
ncbi:PIG-L family deacetylase [Candidatus Woesearchaeota archaeon]|nr:PIG-L family deacetylase [Candidatus Woesearchaeota archaeon]